VAGEDPFNLWPDREVIRGCYEVLARPATIAPTKTCVECHFSRRRAYRAVLKDQMEMDLARAVMLLHDNMEEQRTLLWPGKVGTDS